jgi:hypothetical protein
MRNRKLEKSKGVDSKRFASSMIFLSLLFFLPRHHHHYACHPPASRRISRVEFEFFSRFGNDLVALAYRLLCYV